ncbi:MAG: hypothetical protein J5892_00605 [Bacilli bacterium]|nr:hypothetical protein [Bacilli bacterium]
MNDFLKFVMDHLTLFIIITSALAITLLGYFVYLKKPKKLKEADSDEEMHKKILELKNSPLANETLYHEEHISGLKV